MTLQTATKPRLPIRGTATPDHPTGIIATAATALRIGRIHMPRDLKRAGFVATIVRGREIHDGRYRDCWTVNYSK